jgi:hypothetical protein
MKPENRVYPTINASYTKHRKRRDSSCTRLNNDILGYVFEERWSPKGEQAGALDVRHCNERVG